MEEEISSLMNSMHESFADYKILHGLGRGSDSYVIKVQNRKSLKEFALKVIEKKNKSNIKERMNNEISIHSNLVHQNIVRLHKNFEDSDNYYLLLEYLDYDLQTYFSNYLKKKVTEDKLRVIAYQLAKGIKYIHDRNVIHRDLKPGNILINKKLDIKICDFGLAVRNEKQEQLQNHVCGTAGYMAPEIINNRPYTNKIDVWSFGCILFTMITGKGPFDSPSVNSILSKVKNKQANLNVKDISAELQNLIKNTINWDADQRYTIEQVLNSKFFKIDVAQKAHSAQQLGGQVYCKKQLTSQNSNKKHNIKQSTMQMKQLLSQDEYNNSQPKRPNTEPKNEFIALQDNHLNSTTFSQNINNNFIQQYKLKKQNQNIHQKIGSSINFFKDGKMQLKQVNFKSVTQSVFPNKLKVNMKTNYYDKENHQSLVNATHNSSIKTDFDFKNNSKLKYSQVVSIVKKQQQQAPLQRQPQTNPYMHCNNYYKKPLTSQSQFLPQNNKKEQENHYYIEQKKNNQGSLISKNSEQSNQIYNFVNNNTIVNNFSTLQTPRVNQILQKTFKTEHQNTKGSLSKQKMNTKVTNTNITTNSFLSEKKSLQLSPLKLQKLKKNQFVVQNTEINIIENEQIILKNNNVILSVSEDGMNIGIFKIKSQQRKQFHFDKLPVKYQSLYNYLKNIVNMLKQKIINTKLENDNGKFILYDNFDFEAIFKCGHKIFYSQNQFNSYVSTQQHSQQSWYSENNQKQTNSETFGVGQIQQKPKFLQVKTKDNIKLQVDLNGKDILNLSNQLKGIIKKSIKFLNRMLEDNNQEQLIVKLQNF